MKNKPLQKTFIPQIDGRGLDFIKIAAAVFMVFDHANLMIFHENYFSMHLLGRATFPLFCYALAIAFMRTDPAKALRYGFEKYGLRLLGFAILTEPVSLLTRGQPALNVLFTLCLGAAFTGIAMRLQAWQVYIFYILALATLVFYPPFEFGSIGVVLPSAIVLALQGKKTVYPFLILFIFLMNMQAVTSGLMPVAEIGAEKFLMVALQVGAAGIMLSLATIMIGSMLPQTGRWVPKYFLHIFYPAHLAILWLIAKSLSGA